MKCVVLSGFAGFASVCREKCRGGVECQMLLVGSDATVLVRCCGLYKVWLIQVKLPCKVK